MSTQSPLNGIKVLDLTRILAGPYCTMLLGDLGADVIKIERPHTGDDTRQWGPPFKGTESTYFLCVNRNKKSITVNLKTKEGRDIIKKLAEKCDVLVENYVPGKLAEMGLGYNDLNLEHLIYVSINGFGSHGPYSQRPGVDVIAASYGGLLHITGPENSEPCKVGVAMTDVATGLYAHGAIMAALLHRNKTGKGQHIEADLLSTQLACLVNLGANYLNAQKEAVRLGTAHESIVPYQGFKTSDGYITIGAVNNTGFKEFCNRLNEHQLLEDPRYTSNEQRVKHRDVLIPYLQSVLITKSTSEWLNIFEGCNFAYGPINNLESVFSDPHVKASGQVKELNHPGAGDIKLVGPAVRFSDCENSIRLPPPTLGQHTTEILQQYLNYHPDQIQLLRSKGCV